MICPAGPQRVSASWPCWPCWTASSASSGKPANLIKLLPGLTKEIDGPLQEEVPGVQELTYFCDSKDLKLSFATVHKGYFLGGNLWRGQITARSPDGAGGIPSDRGAPPAQHLQTGHPGLSYLWSFPMPPQLAAQLEIHHPAI